MKANLNGWAGDGKRDLLGFVGKYFKTGTFQKLSKFASLDIFTNKHRDGCVDSINGAIVEILECRSVESQGKCIT